MCETAEGATVANMLFTTSPGGRGPGGRGPVGAPPGRGPGRGGHAPYQVSGPAPYGGRGPAPYGGRGPSHAPAAPPPRSGPAPGTAAAVVAAAAASPMPLPVPTEDFNFEEQNAKFKKDEVAKVRTQTTLRLIAATLSCNPYLNGSSWTVYSRPLLAKHGLGFGLMQEIAEAVKPKGSYSRDDFFDAISCETLERLNINDVAVPAAAPVVSAGRGDGRQRAADARRLDMETFGGLGGLRHNYNYGGRGRGRGGRGGRGDMGGRVSCFTGLDSRRKTLSCGQRPETITNSAISADFLKQR